MARYYLDFTFCSLSNRWSILKNECETTVNAVSIFCLVLTPKSMSHWFQALYRCFHYFYYCFRPCTIDDMPHIMAEILMGK